LKIFKKIILTGNRCFWLLSVVWNSREVFIFQCVQRSDWVGSSGHWVRS